MGKAEQTRANIISKSAELFNLRGYSGTSISDIMQATALEKGGIYNHFASKDAIALAAFDHAYAMQSERYAEAIRAVRGQPTLQLRSIIDVFMEGYVDPAVNGGCVIMNTAIESDDANPLLRAKAAAAMDEWRGLIQRIITKGIARGEFRPETDPAALASIIIAGLEGGLMMSKLYQDPMFIQRVAEHLHSYIDQQVLV
jgi:TetR/AcrR family transcriptional regulator, transcriptional repressor for nem operon